MIPQHPPGHPRPRLLNREHCDERSESRRRRCLRDVRTDLAIKSDSDERSEETIVRCTSKSLLGPCLVFRSSHTLTSTNVVPLDLLPRLSVEDDGVDAVAGDGTGSRLHRRDAGEVRDDVASGLGLEVGVDDRAPLQRAKRSVSDEKELATSKASRKGGVAQAAPDRGAKRVAGYSKRFVTSLLAPPPRHTNLLADNLVEPPPRLGVDGLAYGAEHPEARKVIPVGLVVPEPHEGADRSWCGVELRELVPATCRRERGRSLPLETCRPVPQPRYAALRSGATLSLSYLWHISQYRPMSGYMGVDSNMNVVVPFSRGP